MTVIRFILHWLPFLSTELYQTQLVLAQPLRAHPEWGNRKKLLVDAESRRGKERKVASSQSSLHGQQQQVDQEQREGYKEKGTFPPLCSLSLIRLLCNVKKWEYVCSLMLNVFNFLQMALQEAVEGGANSPGSQYSNWLGSPNSHSNEEFEPWSSFRTRASSDASTLSGRHSPFTSEHDDLTESEGHMIYAGVTGTKISSTLPSVSEVAGSIGQHGSENVMGGLLENLNLVSPKPSQLGSDSLHSSNAAMLQGGPYCSTGLTLCPQQDYRKCMYSQMRMNSLSPAHVQTLHGNKPVFTAYENQYICSAGLLKELLTSDAEASRDMRPSMDSQVSQISRGGRPMPAYTSQSHPGGHNGVKIMNPSQTHPVPHVNPHVIHSQGPSTSHNLKGCNTIPLTSLTSLPGAPTQMSSLKACVQLSHGLPAHTSSVSSSYSYRDLNSVHPHSHHQERLPSDLDSVSIEGFECDMETILHETFMDGGALDFNFDPATAAHGFPQRVKPTAHSWVPS